MPHLTPSLLLLPPPPAPATAEAFSAAYRPTIEAVVSKLKTLPTSTELLIVLPCPSIQGHLSEPRSEIYDDVQHLLGQLYSLFCVVCAKLEVDVESDTPGSIDARVILLDEKGEHPSIEYGSRKSGPEAAGPIIDLFSLALTRRSWNFIFSVDGEQGQGFLANFVKSANQMRPPLQGQMQSVSGGTSMVHQASSRIQSLSRSGKRHHVVAVGGTFDHIHAGHKLLLTATALLLQPSPHPRRLIVGITGDELLKNKKYSQFLGSWKQRQEDVVNFLLSILLFTTASVEESIHVTTTDFPVPNGKAVHTALQGYGLTLECYEIQDPFGPTITDPDITALVVSGETRSGGQAVNQKRSEKGWNALEVFEIDVLDAQDVDSDPSQTGDFASKISSSAIRKRMAENARTSSL